MIGFKAFNKDLTCKGFQFEIGNTYELDCEPIPCKQGFHFCKTIAETYKYYSMTDNTRICKIEAIGDIASDDIKYCTNKIVICEEIIEEWERKGNNNTTSSGYCNSGDLNSGNNNSGDFNSGDLNSGSCNSGDWNVSDNNSGLFNTEQHTLMMFDKPSDWTYVQWRYSKAYKIFSRIKKNVTEWIPKSDMSEKEKENNPSYKTCGGYLKVLDEKENAKIWWDSLTNEEKEIIYALPNFDMKKFKKCVGLE